MYISPNHGSANETLAPDSAQQRARMPYLNEHLAPQDLAFIEDYKTSGSSLSEHECAVILTKRLYSEPPDEKYPSDSERFIAPAYYSAKLAKQMDGAVTWLSDDLESETLPHEERELESDLMEGIQDTKNILEVASKGQMTKLLEEAKLVLMQRGVDGEAQIVEVIDMLDKVLANIERFKEPGASEQSAKFYDLYTEETKGRCELIVGAGRNPLPLSSAFLSQRNQEGLVDQWKRAMGVAQQQARIMARQLQELLSSFAGMPPASQDHGSGPVPADALPPASGSRAEMLSWIQQQQAPQPKPAAERVRELLNSSVNISSGLSDRTWRLHHEGSASQSLAPDSEDTMDVLPRSNPQR